MFYIKILNYRLFINLNLLKFYTGNLNYVIKLINIITKLILYFLTYAFFYINTVFNINRNAFNIALKFIFINF